MPNAGGTLSKAKLTNKDKASESVTVLFNPKEYGIDKTVSWQEHRAPGLDLPELEFTTGDPRNLSLELFIDTTREHTDAREHTKKIEALTFINKEKHRPPIVVFEWGSVKFQGVITKLNQRFTMFSNQGFPLRAVISLSLKEFMTAEEQKKRNPNESPDHTKAWTVTQGETIDSIAAKEYDDPVHWKAIAEANDLEDPARLKPGQKLTLPRLY